jgi:hypothetical protein
MSTLEENQEVTVNELDVLKQRADLLGVTYSNNIGVEKLRERIEEHLASKEEVKTAAPVVEKSFRQQLHDEQMKLVRIRITCMDPNKKDLPGEIVTVANDILGTVRKYIPFGELTDEGYHVPYILYQILEDRKFLNIRTIKDRRTGALRVESTWAKEFAIEVLPQLTEAELKQLATAQIAAGSIE